MLSIGFDSLILLPRTSNPPSEHPLPLQILCQIDKYLEPIYSKNKNLLRTDKIYILGFQQFVFKFQNIEFTSYP